MAQGITTGVFEGRVTDAFEAPIEQALITLIDKGTGVSREGISNALGWFGFSQLAPGEYELLVEKLGYLPVRITNIPVRPGRQLGTVVVLREASGSVTAQEVHTFEAGSVSGTQPQFTQWFYRSQLDQLPHPTRELTDLLQLTSNASLFSGIEGLPSHMLGLAADGVIYRSAASSPFALAQTLFPVGSFEAAELMTSAVDVERSGFAGPILEGYSRRGTNTWKPAALGQWTASSTGDGLDGGESPMNVQGAFVVSGPLVTDSAHFLIGGEVRRYDTPFRAPWWAALDAGAAVASAAEAQEVNLQPFLETGRARTDVFSLFTRSDWQLSGRHRLEARGLFGTTPESLPGAEAAFITPLGQERKSTAGALSAALLSQLGRDATNELRLAASTHILKSEWGSDIAIGSSLPFTTITADPISFGGSAGGATDARRRTLVVTDALAAQAGRHLLKFGAGVEFGSYEETRFFGPQPRALFGGLDEFESMEGLLIQPVGAQSIANFSLSQVSAFIQDIWRPAAGVEFLAGLRWENESLPDGDVRPEPEWIRLTALSNAQLPGSYNKFSPRFALKWDPGNRHRWVFGATAGIYHDEADVGLLASAIANDGRGRVRRTWGNIAQWAESLPTDTTGAPRALTIMPAGYRPPVSVRAGAGVTRLLDAHTGLHISANYRETRNLPRLTDLNLLQDPVAQDANGRPIFGTLQQSGALVAAAPLSNRRFAAFDEVLGVNADGRSQYTAVTLMVERIQSGGLNFIASYTYSQTKDNWYGARSTGFGAAVAPQLGAALSDWDDGVSDFDVPHRVVLAAELGLPAGVKLAALYRYESGLPFTPEVGVGADINGDGFANDPAFIDDQIEGTSELFNEWSCLRTNNGRIAERNSCRSEGMHSLNLRLSAQVLSGSNRLQLYVDGINLLQSDVGIVDRALYHVDPDGEITIGTNGAVTVPLVVNPQFGKIRHPLSLPRMVRIGAQFNW